MVFADSVFSSNNHPQALSYYKQILESGKFSPSMLLKMAYITEESGDIVSALYYLNLYYNLKPEREIHQKMEELAAKSSLKGYDYTDLEYFSFLYREYYYYILFAGLCLAGLYFAHLALKRIQEIPLGIRPLLFITLLIFLFYLINFNVITPKAIVSNNNTFVMSAPAAGSDLIGILERGQRLRVIGKEDIWYKIDLDNDISYVKESDLLIIGSL